MIHVLNSQCQLILANNITWHLSETISWWIANYFMIYHAVYMKLGGKKIEGKKRKKWNRRFVKEAPRGRQKHRLAEPAAPPLSVYYWWTRRVSCPPSALSFPTQGPIASCPPLWHQLSNAGLSVSEYLISISQYEAVSWWVKNTEGEMKVRK